MKRTLFSCVVVAAISIGGALLWYRWALLPMNPHSTVREVVYVPKGASAARIGSLLEGRGLIRSAFAFRILAKRSGLAEDLKAGSFALHPALELPAILEALARGYADEAVVTIPEGFTAADIDALLSRRGLAQSGAILACARTCDFSRFRFLPQAADLAPRGGRIEGYLFPDTYFVVAEGFSPQRFLERMLQNFEERVVTSMQADIAATKRSLHAIVTLASLIEEETRTEEERPIVAGILWKRFDDGRGLGVDAAVRYILEKPTGALTAGDLNIDSPYNLRKFRGLSPGPIASPGLSSIRAALNPQDSPYWYYLHDREGRIRYAVTNDEHNSNRAQYLR